MILPDDFRDVLVALADAGARFVVLGGYAVAYHGHTRATKDLDVFVEPTERNASNVERALAAFGAPLGVLGVSRDDFSTPGRVVQIGLPPLRIDIINEADGITFEDAWSEHRLLDVDGRSIPVIGRNALLRNKRAAARLQDLADVEALEAQGDD